MIGIASPAGSGLPVGRTAITIGADAYIPITGLPVLVLHGPITVRAALGITPERLLVRPLAPLVPSVRLSHDEVTAIDMEEGHWSSLGRRVVRIQRSKGPSIRLLAPPVYGIPDGTDNLGRLLRAWWRSGQSLR